MSAKKRVLICGASIAGPTLAFWLDKSRFDIVIVEKSASFRLGGQNVDIKGPGLEVIEKMQLRKAIEECFTGELGLQFIDDQNEVKAEFPRRSETSFTGEIEILRGDLAKLFYDRTKEDVDYRFGMVVSRLSQHESGVNVTFSNGTQENFDFVFAADGLGSSTRTRIFGQLPVFEYLGVYTSYFTIPRTSRDTDWARWYNAPGGKVILMRPDNKGSIRAAVNLLSPNIHDLEKWSPKQEKEKIKSELKGAGWECDRIADALEEVEDFYFGPVSQVKAPKWSLGRCAMIGDAAYCPSPFTGMGTTLGIVGGYVLASELNASELNTMDDCRKAFEAYECKMRPYVEEKQKLPPGVPRVAYPKSKLGIDSFHLAAGFFASQPAQKCIGFFKKFRRPQEEEFSLP
jgi:2-polyprenyl-6-methoxyphenol hydroxylase-like FAD-dependent oxidoreductase